MSDLEHSHDLQKKFEVYLLALIFTILGLAIQTAKLGSSVPADIMEILGWVSLVASGLVGLSRLEWVPVALKTGSQLQDLRIERTRLQDAADGGVAEIPVVDAAEPVDVQELITSRDSVIERKCVSTESSTVFTQSMQSTNGRSSPVCCCSWARVPMCLLQPYSASIQHKQCVRRKT